MRIAMTNHHDEVEGLISLHLQESIGVVNELRLFAQGNPVGSVIRHSWFVSISPITCFAEHMHSIIHLTSSLPYEFSMHAELTTFYCSKTW